MGKVTISMAIFNSYFDNQRVFEMFCFVNMMKADTIEHTFGFLAWRGTFLLISKKHKNA